MSPSAQLIIIELGCLDICNRNMRKFVVKYNQMECSCKRTSCFGNNNVLFWTAGFSTGYITVERFVPVPHDNWGVLIGQSGQQCKLRIITLSRSQF